MKLEDNIGKIIQVKIIEKKGNWYFAKTIPDSQDVYIEEEGDYVEGELIGKIEKCIILEEKEGKLIGFLLSNRKFIHDMEKIQNSLSKQKGFSQMSQIKDIYLMERLKIKGKVVGLYFVDLGEVGEYYLGTTHIGSHYKKLKETPIIFKENTIENQLAKQIKEVVQSIDLTKKEISLRQEQEKQKHLIEKAIGIELNRQITKIATLDLKQKIEEQEKRNEKVKEEKHKFLFLRKKEQSTTKDVNIKQEMETKDKVTDMKTLGKLLKDNGKLPQIEGKEFTKIGIIESTERDNLVNEKGEKAKTNTTRYSFVAISKDGSVVPLDIEQDHTEGNNPRKINYQVNQKGEVSQDDVLSRFKIGEGTFAVKNGKYGEIKVYHSPRKTIGGSGLEGNKSLDRELETDNIWEIKKEERDLAGEYEDGYRSVEEGYQEAKQHQNEKLKIADIDGEKNTKSHSHDQINNQVDYQALAIKWGYYKEGKPNSEKAQELLEQKRKENPKKETKEIIDMVTEELDNDYILGTGQKI